MVRARENIAVVLGLEDAVSRAGREMLARHCEMSMRERLLRDEEERGDHFGTEIKDLCEAPAPCIVLHLVYQALGCLLGRRCSSILISRRLRCRMTSLS